MTSSKKIPTIKDNSVATWKAVRSLRSSLLALEGHEQHLGANLFRITQGNSSTIDIILLQQSLKAGEETCQESSRALKLIMQNTPDEVVKNEELFSNGLMSNVPNLAREDVQPALDMISRYGGLRAWTDLLLNHLVIRENAFTAGYNALLPTGKYVDTSSVTAVIRTMEDEYDKLPGLPKEVVEFFSTSHSSEESVGESIRAAAQTGIESINAGRTGFLAGGQTKELLIAASARHPNVAAPFGTFGTNEKPQPGIICLIPTGPSLAFCVLVILIAASSHNVE